MMPRDGSAVDPYHKSGKDEHCEEAEHELVLGTASTTPGAHHTRAHHCGVSMMMVVMVMGRVRMRAM
jgi:hypothetical protein